MAEGVAAIVFTDVEGSTALAKAVGDERAKELIEQQRQIVRELLDEHGGREIDTAGDGFMLSFESVRRALQFAQAVQDALAERGEGIRVRIGLHAGEVLERDGHPFGNAVNGAARVSARARGGQVLVSQTVRQLAGDVPNLRFRDRGKTRLKGFDEPWRLYTLEWEGRREMPPLVAKAKRTTPPWVYAAAALVVLGAGLGAWLSWPSHTGSLAVAANSVAAIEPQTGKVVALVSTGSQPSQVVADGGRVWVASVPDGTLTLVDAVGRRAVWTKAMPVSPYGIAAARGVAWVSDTAHYAEVDASTGAGALRAWPTEARSEHQVSRLALAVHGDALWRGYNLALEHVPVDGGVVTTVTRGLDGSPLQLAFWHGGVWSADGSGRLDGFSASAGATQIPIAATGYSTNPNSLGGVAADSNSLWVANTYDDALVQVSVGETPPTQSFPLGAKPRAIIMIRGAVWTANDDGSVTEFDPSTQRIIRRVRVGGSLAGIAYSAGLLWVTVQ